MHDYYVYVYIDPRNHEEFYHGKGTGSRKDAHLEDRSDSEKAKRISEISSEGLKPIIRVIARDLTEPEALLVEKTLLWKLGKWTTNIAGGHFADKFRPHNTLHKELSGFDYHNGVYYYNVGEGPHGNWDDYRAFAFISAGQGPKWRDAMLGFRLGDVFAAYLKRHGLVGVGRIKTEAKMIREVHIGGQSLLSLPLRCREMSKNSNDSAQSEYVCLVDWLKDEPRSGAKWRTAPRLYTTPLIRASLDGQPSTLDFIEQQFGVPIRDIII